MKNIYFNRKNGILRNLDEKPKQKKKVNWDKIVYFIVLGLILIFVFRYFFIKTVYVVAPGHVLFKSLSIRVPEDVTIQEFYKFEGDTIVKGDTLFSYVSYKDEQDAFNQSLIGEINHAEPDNWTNKEIYHLKKNIALNNIQIQERQNLIDFYTKEIQVLRNEVILEITPKSKVDQMQKDIEKLTLENQSLIKNNQTFQSLINELELLYLEHTSTANILGGGIGVSGGGAQIRYYISPIKATITRLYKSNYEVALKSENILNMHEKEDIYIKAFFSQEDIANFQEGDEVTVTFPDGETSIGHIKRLYFATYRMPEEFQKKYESTTRAIAADIFPIENESQIKWKAFYKMNVSVTLSKW